MLQLLLIALLFGAATAKINLTEYFRMPPLFHGDDFDRCMVLPDGKWCVVYGIIKPDPSNQIWNLVERYSNDTKRHYRHDIIQTAQCIPWCRDRLSKQSPEKLDSLYTPEFPVDTEYYIDHTLFWRGVEDNIEHGNETNQCVNLWLQEEYNLSIHTGVQYCFAQNEDYSPDGLDITFLVLLAVIVLLVGVASFVDSTKNEDSNLNHYKSSIEKYSVGTRILLAFSLPRNYYRLTSKPKDELGRDLRYIQTVRTLTVFLVVFGHSVITHGFAPMTNTYFVENEYYSLGSMMTVNGFNVVQSFFSISGFLLTLQFFDLIKNRPFNFNYFWTAIIYRYIRLTPVYAMTILFDATWLYKLDYGPFWKTAAETERAFCRRNWWTNLLYVNNYVNTTQMCLTQGWYLAADFQLFIVSLLILMALWRYPKLRKPILGVALIVSYIIPGIVTYVNRYEGIFTFSPQDKKYIYHPYAHSFKHFYIPAHTNAGNYFFGIAMAMLYMHCKKRKIDLTNNIWLSIAFWLVPVIGLGALLSAYLFYAYDFEKPAIWIGLWAIFSKNVWGTLGGILLFGFSSKIGGFLKNFFNMPIFNSLGRISYCVYLVHFIIFRFLTGDSKAFISISYEHIFMLTLSAYVLSTLVAFIMCLTLEFPFTAMMKEVLLANKKGKAIRMQTAAMSLESNGRPNGHNRNGHIMEDTKDMEQTVLNEKL